jgi:glycosidase
LQAQARVHRWQNRRRKAWNTLYLENHDHPRINQPHGGTAIPR